MKRLNRTISYTKYFGESVPVDLHHQFLDDVKTLLGGTDLGTLEFKEQPISHILYIGFHEITVHANQADRQSSRQKLLLNYYSFLDYILDSLFWGLLNQVFEHQASKVTMQPLYRNHYCKIVSKEGALYLRCFRPWVVEICNTKFYRYKDSFIPTELSLDMENT